MRYAPVAAVMVSALAVASFEANARIVDIEFSSLAYGFYPENLTLGGLRFSPNCHYDIGDVSGTRAFLLDIAGCYPGGQYNQDFLGPSEYRAGISWGPGALWIDAGGRPFNLLEVDFYYHVLQLVSSKGGLYSSGYGPDDGTFTVAFTGGDWRGITSLLWAPYGGGSGEQGMTRLRVQFAPEPGTLALLGLGLVGLGVSRRCKAT